MEGWIAEAVGLMHIKKITQVELAERLGLTREYVSMVLNGKKTPKDAEEKFSKMIRKIAEERA